LNEVPDSLAREIEIVDVFRKSGDVPAVVDEAVRLEQKFGRLKVVWMQLGIVNVDAAEVASRAGLAVVMNRCMAQEHHRLIGGKSKADAH